MSHSPACRVLAVFGEVFANGGIQRFNQTLLDSCGQLDIDCRVLSLNDTATSIARHPKRRHLSVRGFAGNKGRFAVEIFRELSVHRYDWVLIGHVNFLTLTMAAMRLRLGRPIPTIMIAHGIEVWYSLVGLRRRALSRVDRFLCVSRYTRQRILEQAPELSGDRLHVFPNALARTWQQAVPALANYPLPERFILSVTRLARGDRYKGVPTVIEALSMLADESLQYVVVGDGDDLPFLRLIAERCRVKERVHFLSGVADADLIAMYQNCQAFVLPSGKEGFGIVFLEAMFFGAPVIAAGEKGVLDVIRDGETGLLVDFGDTIALRDRIERVVRDQPLRERLRLNGRISVTDGGPFTFDSFTRRCAQAFEVSETVTA
jgi:glycosyltransferase involved in cell wall biosynthesis